MVMKKLSVLLVSLFRKSEKKDTVVKVQEELDTTVEFKDHL